MPRQKSKPHRCARCPAMVRGATLCAACYAKQWRAEHPDYAAERARKLAESELIAAMLTLSLKAVSA